MPRFEPRRPNDDDEEKGSELVVPEAWTEPRCHVCNSKYRKAIDKMIAMGTSHTEISRIFGGEIDRRSIGRHAARHLAYEQAAARRIIEHEAAAAEQDLEEGITGVVKRKVYLETALHKAMTALQDEKVVVEPREALAIIESLNKFDQHTASTQLETIKIHFNAFLQAIREVTSARNDVALGNEIFVRAREIAGVDLPSPPQLNP